jgi:hypothetical protein
MIILMLALNMTIYSQNDFRGLTWGMSIADVKKTETAPLSKEDKNLVGAKGNINGTDLYYDGYLLFYDNVTVAGKNANLIYKFDNGKLVHIKVFFQPALYGYEGTVGDIIMRFDKLFNILSEKGFKVDMPLQCGSDAYMGSDYSNPKNKKILENKELWSISKEVCDIIDEMISEKKYEAAFLRIKNERSRGLVEFYSPYSEYRKLRPVVMELSPSYEIEKGIEKSDF